MPTEKGRQHACTDDGFQQKGRHYKNEENEKYNIRNLFFFPMGLTEDRTQQKEESMNLKTCQQKLYKV